MAIHYISAGLLGANCYIIEKNAKGLIIDPGGDDFRIIKLLEQEKIEPVGILLTHGHADHIGAVESLKKTYQIPIYVHQEDAQMLSDPSKNLSQMLTMPPISFEADHILEEEIEIQEIRIKVLHTPGHTMGSVCFLYENNLFTGDTVCKGSIGRTDLFGGNYEKIMDSIKLIQELPMDIKLFPGHGPATTVEAEKNTNPFFKG